MLIIIYACSIHFFCFVLQRPTIDPCTTLPITGYFIHAIVTRRNANERIYTSKYVDDMLGGTMGEFSVSYNASFEQDLEPNANYIFIVNTQNNVLEISRTDTRSSCNCSKYLYLLYFSHILLSDYSMNYIIINQVLRIIKIAVKNDIKKVYIIT